MLLEFSVTNFLSFKNKVTFSMLGNSSNVLEDNFCLKRNKKILKTAAIYRANASGKTNLFYVLKAVVSMLANSNNSNPNSPLPITPYKLDKKSKKSPSEFEIKFIAEEIEYVYGFKADYKQIYEEYLYSYPEGKQTKIFDRTNVNKYSFTAREKNKLKEIEIKNTPNKFFLATATAWNYDKTKPAYEFLTNNIVVCFSVENLKRIALKKYDDDQDEKLKTFALNFLEQADMNIIDYEVTKFDLSEGFFSKISENSLPSELLTTYQVNFTHKGENEGKLSFDEESKGTQILFYLIPFIAQSINDSSVLIIDELDRSLHPYLTRKIIELFNNKEINKKSSQLIFNTHDTNLLNLDILRRDQIWFTEKDNQTGYSDLYCLSDFSVRKDENIEKGYMLGKYGAVPFIQSDINLWDINEIEK